MGKMRQILWLVGLCMAIIAGQQDRAWGQEKPPIQLPEVVIVGQEERAVQEEKAPIQPDTVPIGLKGDIEAGRIAQIVPPVTGDFAGMSGSIDGASADSTRGSMQRL
jgi:hypothetical protein